MKMVSGSKGQKTLRLSTLYKGDDARWPTERLIQSDGRRNETGQYSETKDGPVVLSTGN